MARTRSMPAHHLDSEIARPVDIIAPDHLPAIRKFYQWLKGRGERFLLADQIPRRMHDFLASEPEMDAERRHALGRLFDGCQEIVLFSNHLFALLRPKVGQKLIVRLHAEGRSFEEITRGHYLFVKDAYVQGIETASRAGLVVDFYPFFHDYPRIKEPAEMGEGLSFLNRQLSGQMYQQPEQFRSAIVEFLRHSHTDGQNILANSHLSDPETLERELDVVRAHLEETGPGTTFQELEHTLRVHGFEPGWGRNAQEIAENLAQLARLIQSPDPERVEHFLERLPLVRTVLMVSPHGWFAQEGVLGRPDTGGQVTYVLDQARALEAQLLRQFAEAGVEATPRVLILTRLIPHAEGTTCGQRREKVHGSQNCWILRVPFLDEAGRVVNDWISRFRIWPYLEGFAKAAKQQVLTELVGVPDLIIGHYTDGNLVAFRLAEEFGSTHCAAVHALEKSKYLFSDMHWREMEHEYHWSCHFTADLIAYNAADYIITSSYREIAGTATEMGMFESYETFSMPELYRVVCGLDPQLARYNIVPPGASEDHFFPHTDTRRRLRSIQGKLEAELFGEAPGPGARGRLDNPSLPPIFAMSRVDAIKNPAGLVELYGKSEALKQAANLILVTSTLDPAQSADREEREQLHRMHAAIRRYQLEGHVRWVAARLDKVETGEAYRLMADRGGVFTQPALMETFGLTVVEAMSCGLPVVVTCFGGPAEIVVVGESGEVADPNNHEQFAEALLRVARDEHLWKALSHRGVQRVEEAFRWSLHAQRILRLANVYSYWNYLNAMNRQALDQYIHTLYHTVYRPRAQAMAER